MTSIIKRKILLLLGSGLALGLAKTPKKYFRVIDRTHQEWQKLNRRYLKRTVQEFYKNRLVDFREKDDGTIKVILTEKGKKRYLNYKIDEIQIVHPQKWDKLWRLVIFDIPEKKKQARNALREKLKELGFLELQKSAWIFPFKCQNEIDFIVEFFEIRQYVRHLIVKGITNEEELKLRFDLS